MLSEICIQHAPKWNSTETDKGGLLQVAVCKPEIRSSKMHAHKPVSVRLADVGYSLSKHKQRKATLLGNITC